MTVNQLNISWTVAPANALLNCRRFPDCAMDTNVFVTLVPMLAPMMIGMAGLTSMTERQVLIKRLNSINKHSLTENGQIHKTSNSKLKIMPQFLHNLF